MDALDAAILRELGIEPFAGRETRPPGLSATRVARALGRNVRLVQDRIARMEKRGVIAGYALIPNPRHLGLELTTMYVPTPGAADPSSLSKLTDVDGFVFTVAYLGEGVCLKLSHRGPDDLERRMNVVRGLVGGEGAPVPMYGQDLPQVERELSPLDWRIVVALAGDARRSLNAVAAELGVTAKTVRARVAQLRDEGSVDDIAVLDFHKMDGVMPFEMAVWCDDVAIVAPLLVDRLRNHYWLHFHGEPGGYCDLLLRMYTTTPAEAQSLVRAAEGVPGVRRAATLMAAGAVQDRRWLEEAMAAKIAAVEP